MKNLKKYFSLIITFSIVIILSQKMYSQKDSENRAMWIFNVAPGITWEDEENISKFTIGVFSSEEEYNELKKLAAKRTIKNKPVEVYRYSKSEEINPNQIIYVTKNENAYLGFVYQKFKGKNVLIISDRSKQPEYSVINLQNSDSSKPFDINTKLANEQNINFSTTILRLGGCREDLRKMQIETNKELIKVQKELREKDSEIKKLREKIKEQEKIIKEYESKSHK